MSTSVDGLVSGLSTTSMIQQLMQVEAAPQNRLKSKASTAQTTVDAYLSVKSKMTALGSAGDAVGQLSTWRGIKATSSSSAVTATAVTGTNTATGTTVFDVKSLAKSQITTAKVPVSGDIMTGDALTIDVGPLDDADPDKHKSTTLTITDRSAKGVADAINAANLGVKATLITTGGGENILQLSGAKTGAAQAFTITGLDQLSNGAPMANIATATDARLEIGGGEADVNLDGFADGYVITSSTNTFSNLMPGVTLTVSKIEDGVTVGATADIDGIAAKFKALVDAANDALTEIGSQTAYNAATKSASTLTGDFGVRNMAQTILSTISQGVVYPNPDYDPKKKPEDQPGIEPTLSAGSYAQFGISLDQYGKLAFNAEQFKKSYAEDPVRIQTIGTEVGGVFETMAANQSKNLEATITGRKTEIDNLNNQISNWDIRLAARKLALQKTYSDLETALGKLKNQSNWLAGQLSGL
ncbi:flagellar filament capping protein FliD [Paractinoplanes brasiliensis]|uniref:Flagellar hook-associated protein 2 n=1 Tax=Paractinoplanes brasiliensis TaxID=52695 RepID=A0A4R6JTP1_9ACTN|nr:flagellar filament capping protein FliD [Actinoplanes brasiliensis]TDO40034.1 flagellar hook-associated protein 2 [Actinoplanes brasiliensis]